MPPSFDFLIFMSFLVEYMNYPVGCGSCQTRFCLGCLQRVLRQSGDNGSQSTDPPNSAKCPHCRSIFTPQSIVQDDKLRKEINDCTDTVTCPFRGCGAELRIGLLKAHEESCPYMRMRCRFADWGCDWVGQRKFTEDHDANQCEFRGGLGKLVERYRQCDAHTGHALHQHYLQIAATSQMLSLHSRQMMLIRNRNAGNVFDILQLAYEASLFPGRFCGMREVWMSLIGQHDAQCLGCNIMLFIPSMVLLLKVSMTGRKSNELHFLYKLNGFRDYFFTSKEGLNGLKMLTSVQLEPISGDKLWLLVDTFLLSFISVSLGIMCLSCFFIDGKSSHEWATYNIRNVVLGPVLRDIASICMAMTNYCTITFKSLPAGIILWQFTTIVTVLYTSFISCIMAKSNNLPSTASAMRASRAWPVVAFGLRYGFLIATCGVSSSISAVVTMRMLKHTTVVSPRTTLDDSECFINQLSTSLLIVMSGFATAFNYATDVDDRSLRKIVLHWMFATGALAYANLLVFLLDEAGRALGEVNFNDGTKILMQARQSSGSTLPNIKPTSVGCSICGVCLLLLLFIATA